MTETDPQSFLPLKPQWFHILLSLASGEQHGYAIMQDVLNRTTGKVRLWPATLYGSIKRLIEADLIEASDERPAPELDDARRRYYRLTSLGKRVLGAECDRLQELVRTIRVKQALVPEWISRGGSTGGWPKPFHTNSNWRTAPKSCSSVRTP
jgi:DNA-binding PadR family transcriptional regulator